MALMAVLILLMVGTILSLGFLSRSDAELACGTNMVLKSQMDLLAESGLEHAKALILNPQDVEGEYWVGDVNQQLVGGSDDYYDVNVKKLGNCNYQITSDAYRKRDGVMSGRSRLTAELRMDPAIALGSNNTMAIPACVTVNGDVYSVGSLTNNGVVNGDVMASGAIASAPANTQGQIYPGIWGSIVPWPGLSVSDFAGPNYYIGSQQYTVGVISKLRLSGVTLGPTVDNPAGIYYRSGNLLIDGNVIINGTLVVTQDVEFKGAGNVITAAKNFPAMIISGQLVTRDSKDPQLKVNGLVQIDTGISITSTASAASIEINGALFIQNGGFSVAPGFDSIVITGVPDKAAIEIWPTAGVAKRWSPVSGAFFKSITRP